MAQFDLVDDWFCDVCSVLEYVKVYVRMCWLKSVAGAWTRTTRTHELDPDAAP